MFCLRQKKQAWKEIKEGRVLLVLDDGSSTKDRIISSPWTQVPKKNSDQTIFDEGRSCHDLRTPVNEYTRNGTLPRVALTTHDDDDVAPAPLRFVARYLGIPPEPGPAGREVSLQTTWVYPGDPGIMATDFLGHIVGFSESLMAVYDGGVLDPHLQVEGLPGCVAVLGRSHPVRSFVLGFDHPGRDGPEAYESFNVLHGGAMAEMRGRHGGDPGGSDRYTLS